MAAVKKKNSSKKNSSKNQSKVQESASFIKDEILILGVLAVSIILLVSSFGVGGKLGNSVSLFMFGIFGLMNYIFPILLFLATAFGISNRNNTIAALKVAAAVLLFILLCAFCQMVIFPHQEGLKLLDYFKYAKEHKSAGGILGGAVVMLLCNAIGNIGTYVLLIVLMIICFVIITERSFLRGVKKGGTKVYQTAKEDVARRQERAAVRKSGQKENRTDKKVSGIARNLKLKEEAKESEELLKEDIHELIIEGLEPEEALEPSVEAGRPNPENAVLEITAFDLDQIEETEERNKQESEPLEKTVHLKKAPEKVPSEEPKGKTAEKQDSAKESALIGEEISKGKTDQAVQSTAYQFPPLELLKKGENKGNGDGAKTVKETAIKLQQTLQNFGVNVTITNVSCGPSVTRYELQPEQGVKVNKIVNLADDIKLNLAATDIRIEAPIPGKAAVGIEVPNKESSAVMLRDLLENEEFQKHPSKLAFAVGKDIGGQCVVSDIAKMPHLLIAGATGSGKSVCINTIIMSILYKARPDEVKLIMIDPKVVELSVYNGIPHLLIPVVTDPKKAAGALQWGVMEMTDRFHKFAEMNVRDLKGYNEKAASLEELPGENKPEKLPQIVIIVDELADLMMVASGEVEDSICRLAQLARAAGIHLIIATQRPSVNVITGIIKANMPSRIAFAVSSGVDSRTIIDSNGAEKLLGKGDMLFYPSGFPKPARIQCAFVSDPEVGEIVKFLSEQTKEPSYNREIEDKMNLTSVSAQGSNPTEYDMYFAEAGKFVIEKEKASIGMIQRMFKVGFNRAARIMDQLTEAGVVGEEEGTKPRKVLMSLEEFEAFVEEFV